MAVGYCISLLFLYSVIVHGQVAEVKDSLVKSGPNKKEAGVHEERTPSLCRDRFGILPPDNFTRRSCLYCYVYQFFNDRRTLIPASTNEDFILVSSNISLPADFKNKTIKDLVCGTLNGDECERWVQCSEDAIECCEHQMSVTSHPDAACPPTWDGFKCWDFTPHDTDAKEECPSFIPDFSQKLTAIKHCRGNATWFTRHGLEWTNYTSCINQDKVVQRDRESDEECQLSTEESREACIDLDGSGSRSQPCNGRGDCICGRCECLPLSSSVPSKTFSGQYCECDDYSCDYFQGELCGGPTRGHCKCGLCQCNEGYEGSACECPTSTASCMAANGKLCNGRSGCVCGTCHCNYNYFSYYKGPTCEDCPTCVGNCEILKPCIQCFVYNTGPLDEEECQLQCQHKFVPVVNVTRMPHGRDYRKCSYKDDEGCDVHFAYKYLDSSEIRVQRVKECPPPPQEVE